MEINEIQTRIIEIANNRAKKKGIEITPEISFIHLTEEFGELARQLSNKQMRPDLYDEENLKEEIIDIILECLILAKLFNTNLEQEFKKKIELLAKKHTPNP
ncbi:nucleotide pyrophosphohydrolase [Candidatus Woesearchaeota archaeon]|nr:nucleotide pyrophosphohydrolase [Candidatus Woesearchaeota archaeon]